MWFFKRCVDCNHLCTGKCEICRKPLCFECAGGIFQFHGYSPGFGKCKTCKDEMGRQARSSFPLHYKSPYTPERGILMKRLVFVGVCLLLLLLTACGDVAHGSEQMQPRTSVCIDTGLTGPALQENRLFCSTDRITGAIANCCFSVYPAAIDLARVKHIVVGTPRWLTTTVDWAGKPVSYVEFSGSFHAWHYNDGSGVVVIDDQYDKRVWP